MLSHKVVIVQASKDSGAIYTATCGLKYNKEVYAVPGNIYDKSRNSRLAPRRSKIN